MEPKGHGLISCIGKESFDSPELALLAAQRRPGRDKYRCPFCGKWHVSGKHGKSLKRGDRTKTKFKLCGDPNA